MVKTYKLNEPHYEDERFAYVSDHGKMEVLKEGPPGLCPECTGPGTIVIDAQPWIIEWEPGSNVIADFVWPLGGGRVGIREEVAKALGARFGGFESGPIEMIQAPKLKKPKRITKRTRRRVWLPYEGPALHELWITRRVHIDLERSTVRVHTDCGTCGLKDYRLEGVEKYESKVTVTREPQYHVDRTEWKVARRAGEGVYIHEADLQGDGFFRLDEYDGPMLCTEPVKEFIEEQGFTNIEFLEMGDAV